MAITMAMDGERAGAHAAEGRIMDGTMAVGETTVGGKLPTLW